MVAEVYATIASYRDPMIVDTVRGLIRDPGCSLRVAVILQDEDQGIVDALADLPVEVLRLDPEQARGPGWARALGQSLWEDEPWYYMCDAHMQHTDGWATALIEEAKLAREMSGQPPIVSTYCMPFGQLSSEKATVMDIRSWHKMNIARIGRVRSRDSFNGKPAPARLVSAHHFLAPGRWCDEVPYDPRIYFGSEEFTLGIRSWTSGYDLWHPSVCVATHKFGRDGRSTHWADFPETWGALLTRSAQRAAVTYGWKSANLGVYGIGSARSLEAYQRWSCIDLAESTYMPDREWRPRLIDVGLGA